VLNARLRRERVMMRGYRQEDAVDRLSDLLDAFGTDVFGRIRRIE